MTAAFDAWLAKQLQEGMVDIKFAAMPGKGVSAEAIKSDLLAAEAAIASGYVRPAPAATSQMPEDVASFVAAH